MALKIAFIITSLILLAIYSKDLIAILSNQELLEKSLASLGHGAWIGFLLVNILQIIIAPIPGTVVGVAGGFLFGFWQGFTLNYIGILVGSMVAFLLAKWLGKPVVDKFVGGKVAKYLEKVATSKGIKGLALVLLLPFLPDDALCFVAGLTPISLKTFFVLVAVFRLPSVAVASMTGSGIVQLPLTVWVIIGILALAAIVLYWQKGDQIEAWMRKLVLDN